MKRPDQKMTHVMTLFNTAERFEIPIYQRSYTWRTDDAELFLNDYFDFVENYDSSKISDHDQIHFLGAIYLSRMTKKDGNTMYDIVDGQQRITTLMLLLNAVKRTIQKIINVDGENFNEDLEIDLIEKMSEINSLLYIDVSEDKMKTTDTGWTWTTEYNNLRLHVQKSDEKKFFESINTNHPSDRYNYAKTIRTFREKLYEKYNSEYENEVKSEIYKNPRKWYKKYIRPIFNNIELLRVEIKTLDDAYATFERLNNRGVKLSVFDLLNIKILSRAVYDEKLQKEYVSLKDKIIKKCRELKLRPVKIILQHYITKFGKISEKNVPNEYSKKFDNTKLMNEEFREILIVLSSYEKLFSKNCDHISKNVEIYKVLNTPYFRYAISYLESKNVGREILDRFTSEITKISWNANFNSTSLGAKYSAKLHVYVKNAIENNDVFIPKNDLIQSQFNGNIITKSINNSNLMKYALYIDDMVNGIIDPKDVISATIHMFDDADENRIDLIEKINIDKKQVLFNLDAYISKIPDLEKYFDSNK